MQIYSEEELNDLVSSYREKLSNESKGKDGGENRRESGSYAAESLFHCGPIIERLLNESPPSETYLLNSSDSEPDTEDYKSFFHSVPTLKLPEARKPGVGRSDENASLSPIIFHAEEVNTDKSLNKSKITELLQPNNENPAFHAVSGPSTDVTVYMPSKHKITIEIGLSSSISDLIILCIKHSSKLNLTSDAYELKHHEQDGNPSDDLPALDPTTSIHDCIDTDAPSFVLLQKKGFTSHRSTLKSEYLADLAQPVQKVQGGYVLKVLLPQGSHTVLPIKEDTTAYDLFEKIVVSCRLDIDGTPYDMCLEDKDVSIVNRVSNVLPMDTNLYDDVYLLGIRTLVLKQRYYDNDVRSEFLSDIIRKEKRESLKLEKKEMKVKKRDKNERVNPETILYNETTGYLLQNWEVIKTNKWGKRQKRILGIDRQKIYNKVRDKDATRIKTSERLISDIIEVCFYPDNISSFQIVYKKKSKIGLLLYEAEGGPKAVAEIMSKIKYIQQHS